ncbi:cutinase family protein [Lentzea sp. NPDC004789]
MKIRRLSELRPVNLIVVAAVAATFSVAQMTGGAASLAALSQCAGVSFVAAMGSGQAYSGPTNLDPSQELKSAYTAFHDRLGGRVTDTLRVLNYPALPVDVIVENLDGNPLANLQKVFGTNLPKYLAGKDVGIQQLWKTFTAVRTDCPDQKIVLAGYSQGAMVVHQFLEQLSRKNDNAGQAAIRGVILLADPDRVRFSTIVDFGDADFGSDGICVEAANFGISCTSPDRLTDIPGRFKRSTVGVCFIDDIVCDTSRVIHDYIVNTPEGRKRLVKVAVDTHVFSYRSAYQTRLTGQRVAQMVLPRP